MLAKRFDSAEHQRGLRLKKFDILVSLPQTIVVYGEFRTHEHSE